RKLPRVRGARAIEAGAGLLGGTDGLHYGRLGNALRRQTVGCECSQKSAERQCQGLAHESSRLRVAVPRSAESKGRKQPTSKGGCQNKASSDASSSCIAPDGGSA